MPARTLDYIVGETTTTGAGSSVLVSSTPPNGINSFVLAWILARCPTTGDRAQWFRSGYVNKTAGGVLTVDKQEDVVKAYATNGIKQADIDVQISGGTVSILAIGDASQANLIEWQAHVQVTRL